MQEITKLRNMTSLYLLCDDKILLLYRQGSRVVNNQWVGAAGGHFEENELNDARSCVLRELHEELSMTENCIRDLELRYITIRKTSGELRQNYYFFARLPGGTAMNLQSNEGILQWVPLDECAHLKMPFSARFMMAHYLETGRYDHILYGGISDGQKVIFTKLNEN